MMQVKEIEFNNKGEMVSMKGIVKGKKIKANSRLVFSKITNKIIYWADLDLEYAGG